MVEGSSPCAGQEGRDLAAGVDERGLLGALGVAHGGEVADHAELDAVVVAPADGDSARRRVTGVPEAIGHREKWRLALDTLDELAGWGLTPPVVVADAGYGQNADFRHALAGRDIPYVAGIRGDLAVQPGNAAPIAPPWPGNGRKLQLRCRQPPVAVAELATDAGAAACREVTWREGSRGPMTSRFLAVRPRPAGVRPRRLAQAAAVAEHGQWDGVLPDVWLLAEWPDSDSEPTRFWLSGLPDDTPITELVRLAKIRWRIEHDYRELKHGLGLDHFEGRSWNRWHHHATWPPPPTPSSPSSGCPQAGTPDSPSTRSSMSRTQPEQPTRSRVAPSASKLQHPRPGIVSREAASIADPLLRLPPIERRNAFKQHFTPRERAFVMTEVERATGSLYGLWRDTPSGFVEDVLGESLWSKQRAVLDAIVDHTRVAVPAGFGVGKTHLAARAAVWFTNVYPVGTALCITTATRFRQVQRQLWPHIRKVVPRAGLPGDCDTVQYKMPTPQGHDFVAAYGFSAPANDEAAMQEIHMAHILLIVDEAGGIAPTIGHGTNNLLTGGHAAMLAIGNPAMDDPSSWFEELCIEGDNPSEPSTVTIPISSLDSPAITRERVPFCTDCPEDPNDLHTLARHLRGLRGGVTAVVGRPSETSSRVCASTG